MNTEDFVKELVGKTGLSQEQGAAAGDVFESTYLAGNKDENLIVGQLSERLGIDKSQAEMIYNVGVGLLAGGGVVDKIKNIL